MLARQLANILFGLLALVAKRDTNSLVAAKQLEQERPKRLEQVQQRQLELEQERMSKLDRLRESKQLELDQRQQVGHLRSTTFSKSKFFLVKSFL
jgi:hypothetical protein